MLLNLALVKVFEQRTHVFGETVLDVSYIALGNEDHLNSFIIKWDNCDILVFDICNVVFRSDSKIIVSVVGCQIEGWKP